VKDAAGRQAKPATCKKYTNNLTTKWQIKVKVKKSDSKYTESTKKEVYSGD